MKYQILQVNDKFAVRFKRNFLQWVFGARHEYLNARDSAVFDTMSSPENVLQYCLFNTYSEAETAAKKYVPVQDRSAQAIKVLRAAKEVKI